MGYVEHDPQVMISRVEKRQEAGEMTVGQIMDQRRLRKKQETMIKEKSEMSKRIDYKKHANGIVKNCDMTQPTTVKILGEIFGIKEPSTYNIKKIKEAFELVGYRMVAKGKGSYVFTELKRPDDKPEEPAAPEKKAAAKEISLDEMTEQLIKNHVEKVLAEKEPAVVAHPEYDMLKTKIKTPEAMLDMNQMMEGLQMGLKFVIKEIELVECPVPK